MVGGSCKGVITSNSLVEVAEQEATEDMFRLFGVGGGIGRGPISGSRFEVGCRGWC